MAQDFQGFLADIGNSLKAVQGDATALGKAATDAWTRFNSFKTTAVDMAALVSLLSSYTSAIKGVSGASEHAARIFENEVAGSIKGIGNAVEKAKSKFGELKDSIGATATSLSQFASSGNNAHTSANNLVSSFTALLGAIPLLGPALEASVNIFIGMSNKIQETNRVILDLNASTGQLGRGFDLLTNDKGAKFAEGIANFALLTGRSSEEIRKFAGDMGRAGFSMEEMGWDTETGAIDSFTKGIGGAATSVGGLATAFGFARSMGVDVGQVLGTMQVMMKEMGVSSEGTIKALYSIEGASRTAGVSQAVMLQSTQQLQGAFKYLGMDSERVIMSLGAVGAAAQRAGFGGQLGVEVFTQAAQGLMSNFSMMTFMGQRLGMGKGLGAGFAMRESMVSDGGVLNVGKSIESMTQLLGGRYVSRGEAAMGGPAAASRLAQEQMAMQMFGVSQNQASSLLDMSEKLTGLERAGLGGTTEAKSLAAIMSQMTMTEKGWRDKTLTLQEKIAFALELIYATLTKVGTMIVNVMLGSKGAITGFSLVNTLEGMKSTNEKNKVEMTQDQWIDSLADFAKAFDNAATDFANSDVGKTLLSGLGGVINDTVGLLGELGIGIKGIIELMVDLIPGFGHRLDLAKQSAESIKKNETITQNIKEGGKKEGTPESAVFRSAITAVNAARSSGTPQENAMSLEKQKSDLQSRGLLTPELKALFDNAIEKMKNRDDLTWREHFLRSEMLPNIISRVKDPKENTTIAISAVETLLQGLTAGQIKNANKESISRATAIPKTESPVKDAWDISKAGWLYASQGDVVVDSKSIGRALSSGNRGDALNYSQIFSQSSPASSSPAAGGQQNIEHDIVFNVRVNSDMLGTIVDQRVVYNIDKDIIKPGRGYSNASQGSVSR